MIVVYHTLKNVSFCVRIDIYRFYFSSKRFMQYFLNLFCGNDPGEKENYTKFCKEVVVYLLHMRLPGQQNMEQSNPYPMEFIF